MHRLALENVEMRGCGVWELSVDQFASVQYVDES